MLTINEKRWCKRYDKAVDRLFASCIDLTPEAEALDQESLTMYVEELHDCDHLCLMLAYRNYLLNVDGLPTGDRPEITDGKDKHNYDY